jgi:hypothetical protein
MSGTPNSLPTSLTKMPAGKGPQNPPITKQRCEYLRNLSKQRFFRAQSSWLDVGRWAAPHRIKWMEGSGMLEGMRNNAHIVDTTHILALRSFVAGFLEGNTSASRPWARFATSNEDINDRPDVHLWLQRFGNRVMDVLGGSNFYNAAGQFYYDYGVFNTGAHYIQDMKGRRFYHTLIPGSYYVINNGLNEAATMVREMSLTVKAIVDTYGIKDKHGNYTWDNISGNVRKMYEDGNYTTQWTIVHVMTGNDQYDPSQPISGWNQPWISVTYELGGTGGQNYEYATEFSDLLADTKERQKWLSASASRRKPFVVGKSDSGMNFEYGEVGPTLQALGLIKSLNKKTIAEDQAIEQMLRPALQGPANLRKSYITTAANSYVPLDPTSMAQGKGQALRSIFEINPALPLLTGNKEDLRQQINKLYYADYLLYLTQNPKTRTAEETRAVVQEQQLVIGPNLQSLNTTYNIPIIENVADYVLFDDPYMKQFPMPDVLAGQFLRPEFISVFAQAQRAADMPAINQYLDMVERVGQLQPSIWDKANLDKLADIYEDRLFLPSGINRPQEEVDAKRQAAQAQQQRQQMLEQTLPAVAKAAKDGSSAVNQVQNSNGGGPQ